MTDITYGALSQMRPRTPREKARDAALAQSVMSRSTQEQWQPEYQKEPGLEAPLISPEDLLLMGGPSAAKTIAGGLRNARLLGGKSGAIPLEEFLRNKALFQAPQGQRTLYHTSPVPWEGDTPRVGTWFSTEPPTKNTPFGNTVRAYTVPEEQLAGTPIARGRGNISALESYSGAIVPIDEGGMTSYVVKDPSVLQRLAIKRPIISRLASGTPASQVGAYNPNYELLVNKLANLTDDELKLLKETTKYDPNNHAESGRNLNALSAAWNLKNKKGYAEDRARRSALDFGRSYVGELSDREKGILNRYVLDSSLNYALRENASDIPRYTQEYLAELDDIIKRAPRATEPFTVYRTAPTPNEKSSLAYSSTSIDRDTAKRFLTERKDPENIIQTLRINKNVPLIAPDVNHTFYNESELLLPRGSVFRKNGRLYDVTVPEDYRDGGLVQAPDYFDDQRMLGMRKGGLVQMKECHCGR